MDDLVERARAALDGVTPGSWHPEYCEASNVWHIDAGAYPIGTEICKCKSDANARFVAAARSLVPEMADRIAALESDLARAEAKLAEAGKSLRECASELEASVEAEWPERLREKYPIYQTKFERDMEPVIRARAILASIKEGE